MTAVARPPTRRVRPAVTLCDLQYSNAGIVRLPPAKDSGGWLDRVDDMGEIRVESWSRGTSRSWSTIKDRIAELEHECFGGDAFSPSELRLAFTSRKSVVVLLWDGPSDRGRLVGYTQAQPADDPATFYIANTAIARSHQGRGLVRLLMSQLYADVRAAGARFIERDAAIANGYADKIVGFHAADVLETFDHDSPYGPQRFIRMRVPET